MALYKISSSRVNNIEADQYAGSVVEEGLIWYDPNTGALRLYNGQPGGQLIGGSSSYGNANVAAFLPTYTGNLIALQGNITTTGNVQGSYIIGNGSLLTGIAASLPAQPGNAGKYLSTNGTVPSWQTVAGVFGLTIDGGNAVVASTDFVIDAGGA